MTVVVVRQGWKGRWSLTGRGRGHPWTSAHTTQRRSPPCRDFYANGRRQDEVGRVRVTRRCGRAPVKRGAGGAACRGACGLPGDSRERAFARGGVVANAAVPWPLHGHRTRRRGARAAWTRSTPQWERCVGGEEEAAATSRAGSGTSCMLKPNSARGGGGGGGGGVVEGVRVRAAPRCNTSRPAKKRRCGPGCAGSGLAHTHTRTAVSRQPSGGRGEGDSCPTGPLWRRGERGVGLPPPQREDSVRRVWRSAQ